MNYTTNVHFWMEENVSLSFESRNKRQKIWAKTKNKISTIQTVRTEVNCTEVDGSVGKVKIKYICRFVLGESNEIIWSLNVCSV